MERTLCALPLAAWCQPELELRPPCQGAEEHQYAPRPRSTTAGVFHKMRRSQRIDHEAT